MFKQLGEQIIEQLTAHLEAMASREPNVLNWRLPAENIADANAILNGTPVEPNAPEQMVARFRELVSTALSRSQNLHHPRYIGHQVAAPSPIAGLFDALGAVTNQGMAIYEMGPWATACEQALITAWGERLGFPPNTFSGLITNGGSLANLTALITARNVALPDAWEQGLNDSNKPVILVQGDAHYSISKAAGIIGLGTEQVLKVPVDNERRMDVTILDKMLTELAESQTPVIAVCACACATPIGAFDRIDAVADVCEKHNTWLHVDAAHGGAAIFSDKHRHLLTGIDRADSVICDAHKTLFVPALCAFVFYKNKTHRFEAFRQEAPYLFDPSAPDLAEVDSGIVTIECTKRAASYTLWGLWSLFGPELFSDLIDVTFETARQLYNRLEAADDFETLHDPDCNIVVFRYHPQDGGELTLEEIGQLNRRIRWQLIESGEFYIVQTNFDGIGALRITVMNPLTTEQDIDQLVTSIRTTAARLMT